MVLYRIYGIFYGTLLNMSINLMFLIGFFLLFTIKWENILIRR